MKKRVYINNYTVDHLIRHILKGSWDFLIASLINASIFKRKLSEKRCDIALLIPRQVYSTVAYNMFLFRPLALEGCT